MLLTATIRTDDGKAIGILVLKEKVFRSGKQGFFGQSKIEIAGQRYQCQAQMVGIAAKNDSSDVGAEE